MAPTRKTSLLLSGLFAGLLLAATLASASIEAVCKKASDDFPDVEFSFCVSSLKAAPGGSSADDDGLAVVTGNLGSQKARSTLDKVDGLLKSASNVEKELLEACQAVYKVAVDSLKAAADAAGQNKYDDARKQFAVGEKAAVACEDNFHSLMIKSPLENENRQVYQLACIGKSIAGGALGPE